MDCRCVLWFSRTLIWSKLGIWGSPHVFFLGYGQECVLVHSHHCWHHQAGSYHGFLKHKVIGNCLRPEVDWIVSNKSGSNFRSRISWIPRILRTSSFQAAFLFLSIAVVSRSTLRFLSNHCNEGNWIGWFVSQSDQRWVNHEVMSSVHTSGVGCVYRRLLTTISKMKKKFAMGNLRDVEMCWTLLNCRFLQIPFIHWIFSQKNKPETMLIFL